MKYLIIAGEASGDLHASKLIESLSKHDGKAEFVFLGGDMMSKAANRKPLVHIKDMAFMGFSEVLKNLGTIRKNMRVAKNALKGDKPDALILVDYPTFNLKVAKTAKSLGIPVFYYISPKVWAWKEYRVKAIKRLVDKMFVIFPFEADFYRTRHDFDVEYVGDPTLEEVDTFLATKISRQEFLEKHRLRDRQIIALLPGSRRGEIRNNLRVMTSVIERLPQYRGVLAGASNIPLEFYRQYTDLPVVYGDGYALLSNSTAALVTSGTATLETALIGTPQVACYRSNGKKIAYEIMKRVLKVPFVTLPNLIAGYEVIPEMLVHNCTPETVTDRLIPLLRETRAREKMIEGYEEIRKKLHTTGSASDNTAAIIVKSISSIKNTQ